MVTELTSATQFRSEIAPDRYEALRREIERAELDALILVARHDASHRGPMRFIADWHVHFVMNVVYAVVTADGDPIVVTDNDRQARTVENMSGLEVVVDHLPVTALARVIGRAIGDSGKVGIAWLGSVMPVADLRVLEQAFPGVEFVEATEVLEAARAVKSPEDIEAAREGYAILAAAYSKFVEVTRVGVSEREIQAEIEYVYRMRGAWDVNTLMGSGKTLFWDPPSTRKLEPGDMITCLFEFAGPRGLWVERATMASLGEPDPEIQRLYAVCVGAKAEAAKAMRPGSRASDAVAAAKAYVTETAPDFIFDEWMGHGIGLDVIEAPEMMSEDHSVLQEGMLISLHPRVLFGDRSNTASVGDTYVIGADGAEPLLKLPHEFAVL